MNLQIIYFSQKKCDGIWDWFKKDWSGILIMTGVVWLRIWYSIPQKWDKDNEICPGYCKKNPNIHVENNLTHDSWEIWTRFARRIKLNGLLYVGEQGFTRQRVNISTHNILQSFFQRFQTQKIWTCNVLKYPNIVCESRSPQINGLSIWSCVLRNGFKYHFFHESTSLEI